MGIEEIRTSSHNASLFFALWVRAHTRRMFNKPFVTGLSQ